MRRLIFSLIGVYVFIAALISITTSTSANTQIAKLTNWETIHINLPFDLKDLEDGSYDGLLAIGTHTRSFFTGSFETLGQLAILTNAQINKFDKTIASAVQLRSESLTFANAEKPVRVPSIFQKSHDTLLALAHDMKSFTQETMPTLPDLKKPLQQAANHLEKNLKAIALLGSVAQSFTTDYDKSPALGTILGQTIIASNLSNISSKLLCPAQLYDDQKTARKDDDLFLIDPAKCKEFMQPNAPPTPVYPPPK